MTPIKKYGKQFLWFRINESIEMKSQSGHYKTDCYKKIEIWTAHTMSMCNSDIPSSKWMRYWHYYSLENEKDKFWRLRIQMLCCAILQSKILFNWIQSKLIDAMKMVGEHFQWKWKHFHKRVTHIHMHIVHKHFMRNRFDLNHFIELLMHLIPKYSK